MGDKHLNSVGRYLVEKKIGQGSMGMVYLARDDMIDRQVAVKSLRMDKIKTDGDRARAQEMFFQEVKTVGKLSHSHITTVYDVGLHENAPFMVMEYVDGLTIKKLIEEKDQLSLKEKLVLVAMIAHALHYAHQRGILHRDIKPANIMIIDNISPKIMDFGIAVIKDATSSGWSSGTGEEGVIMGTPFYMSPEQVCGRDLDQRSDLFSLGILTYEWLSGMKPFSGKSLGDILKSIVKEPHTPLKDVLKSDKDIQRILDKALAKDPEERFANAEEFSDALELYVNKIEKKDATSTEVSISYDKLKVIEQLKKNYVFFSDFTDEELFVIFQLSGKEKYDTGEAIVEEGTSGSKMYIIISGEVAIMKDMKGAQIELKKLGAGACVGEMSIIDKMPRSASVVTLEPTVVIAINETVLRHSNPKLCLKLYRSLAAMVSEKLRQSDQKYFDLLSETRGN